MRRVAPRRIRPLRPQTPVRIHRQGLPCRQFPSRWLRSVVHCGQLQQPLLQPQPIPMRLPLRCSCRHQSVMLPSPVSSRESGGVSEGYCKPSRSLDDASRYRVRYDWLRRYGHAALVISELNAPNTSCPWRPPCSSSNVAARAGLNAASEDGLFTSGECQAEIRAQSLPTVAI
jgi:hypothetical protein